MKRIVLLAPSEIESGDPVTEETEDALTSEPDAPTPSSPFPLLRGPAPFPAGRRARARDFLDRWLGDPDRGGSYLLGKVLNCSFKVGIAQTHIIWLLEALQHVLTGEPELSEGPMIWGMPQAGDACRRDKMARGYPLNRSVRAGSAARGDSPRGGPGLAGGRRHLAEQAARPSVAS